MKLLITALISSLYFVGSARAEEAPPPQVDRMQQAATAFEVKEFPTFGAPNAPHTLVIFQDMHCGMCRWLFKETFVHLKESFIEKGHVKLMFVPYPLIPSETSLQFEKAALCAHEQDRYALFLAFFYNLGREASASKIPGYAKTLLLDEAKFNECLSSSRPTELLAKARSIGDSPALEGTPTLLLNGKEIGGAMPWAVFEPLLTGVVNTTAH